MRVLMAVLFIFLLAMSISFCERKTFMADADAWLNGGQPIHNNGNSSTGLAAGVVTETVHRSLLYFDLSELSDSIITAVCSIYCYDYSGPEDKYNLFCVPEDWVEGTADGTYEYGSSSWNNRGHGTGVAGTVILEADSAWTENHFVNELYASVELSESQTWAVFDVTSLVNQLISNGNYGFCLKKDLEENGGAAVFVSSELGSIAQGPRLIVEWEGMGTQFRRRWAGWPWSGQAWESGRWGQ